ncbi:hypothetical protein [Streptomyces sp. NPDC093260]|uniref:hypothetical protein n=1 Tax=Streptomyces sp. NPDC093260 TaxID=3155073 RepID=UPI003447FFDE
MRRRRRGPAARLPAWSAAYLVLGVWWWPAAVIGLAAAVTTVGRGRDAAECLADLTEALAGLHTRPLAETLGIPCESGLSREVGTALTRAVNKGGE